MRLTEVQILAVPCEVHVSDRGTFSVYLAGHAGDEDGKALAHASTFDDAVEKAKPQVRQRKVKVSVPFYRPRSTKGGGLSFEPGTATGFHAGTGNVLVVIGGDTEQLAAGHRGAGTLYRGDTPTDIRGELMRLRREMSKLESESRRLNEKWTIDIAEAVREAIEAAS